MFGTYFGKYLIDEGVITENQYGDIMSEVRQSRMKLGEMANAEGYMTDVQAEEINNLQLACDEKFGELAVEKGYLEEGQVEELLEKQKETYLIFVKILIGEYNFTPEDIQKHVNNFKRLENLTAREMDTLKSNDIDNLMSIFTKDPDIPELIRRYIYLLAKNLIRFTENSIRFEAVETTKQYASGAMIYQSMTGDSSMSVGVCSGKDAKGLYVLGGYFSDNMEKFSGSDRAVDKVADFIDMTNSLFVRKENDKHIVMNKGKLRVYNDIVSLSSEDNIYIMPFYIAEDRVDIMLTMDKKLMIS